MASFINLAPTDVVGPPAPDGTRFIIRDCNDILREIYELKVVRYRQYIKTKLISKRQLRRLEDEILFKLPPELLGLILGLLATDVYPRHNVVSTFRDLHIYAINMLRHLPSVNASGDPKETTPPLSDKEARDLFKIATNAILKNCIIAPTPVDFHITPSKTFYAPTPYPFIKMRKGLHNLHLTVTTPEVGESLHQSHLLRIRCRLHFVKKWFPNLKSLSIEVEQMAGLPPIIMLRGMGNDEWWTALKVEVRALVVKLRSLNIAEMCIWSYDALDGRPMEESGQSIFDDQGVWDQRDTAAWRIAQELFVTPDLEIRV